MIGLVLAVAAQAQQFDLDCSGAVPGVGPMWAQAEVRFRIDLDAGRWCYGDCKTIQPVAELQPAVIWFEKASAAEDVRGLVHFRAVNRETGEYTFVHESPDVRSIGEKAMCARRPFTGFPHIVTKF